ncbi:neuropeptide SIFamide receptor-like isoform X1 [Portunus trituberculatus]|uniref:neuropeptide SIFamide receptor-like isoform X1 n=1 Tax=Portunus trituberculatus TaxID=210409 RepID=UPI001E1D1265|nr:neuropeptide SIFamide receptor-like isoform X1 [Portunus trituberculatus]
MASSDMNTTAGKVFFPDYDYDFNDSQCLVNGSISAEVCPEFEFPMFRHSLQVTILYCVSYVLVSLMGVVGNSFVVAVVMRAPRMRTVTNVFIANLAVADLLVNIIVLPTTLIGHLLNAWVLGLFVCKAMSYLQGVSVSASINTLVAISVDRALAICYPMRCQITSRTCRSIILVIWVFSLTITLPWAIYFTLEPIPKTDLSVCTDRWPDEQSGNLYFVLANLVMCYLLPLTVISICYILIWRKVWRRKLPGERQDVGVAMMMHRSKIKVIKMLLVVVILFALSWLPLYVIFARLKLGVALTDMENNFIHILAPIAQWLGASNSCINPILYAFFNDKFRAGFKAILVSHSCCSPLRLETNCKSFTSVKTPNPCSLESKASSEFSVYSSSSGSAETRRKSVLVQIPLDSHSARTVLAATPSEKRRCVATSSLLYHHASSSPTAATTAATTKRRSTSSTKPRLLYRQCIINNLTNGGATAATTTTTTAMTTTKPAETTTTTSTTATTTTTTSIDAASATQTNGCSTLV